MDIKEKIRKVENFPNEGALYYDITTMLKDSNALRHVVNEIIEHYINKKQSFDKVVSASDSGRIFGAILAHEMHAGFVQIESKGKLPGPTHKEQHESDYLEVHQDSIEPHDAVLIVDDFLINGKHAKTAAKLVKKAGGIVKGMAFIIELNYLKGRDNLEDYDVFSVVSYDQDE